MSAISPFLDGLDVSNPDVTTPAEIEAFKAFYARTKGGLIASHAFWLEFRPDVLKRQRARARLTSAEGGGGGMSLPHVLAYIHLYTILAFEEGILYEIKLAQSGGATFTDILDVLAIAFLHAGPRGISAVASSSIAYLRAYEEPEPVQKFPATWSHDPSAFDSGMDYSLPQATNEDMNKLKDWYQQTIGEVPRHVEFLARHNPNLLKAFRNRYEHAIRDSLPKQMVPYMMLNYNVVRGNSEGIRENVLLGRALGMTRSQLLDAICWGMSYGGPNVLDVVDASVGELLTMIDGLL
jgi:hypothetical protein